MKNILLDERTIQDIDERIARIHRDLSHSGGPVDLKDVRGLLKLDLSYYKADDPGVLKEVVHKLKLGGKQVLDVAMALGQAVRKFDLKALFVPKQREILIDIDLPDLKKRWSEGHEIVHSVIPWHSDYLLGDNKHTLTPGCHDRIESEANFGAGRLFFPPMEFAGLRQGSPICFAQVIAISKHFGNTITSTLWRYVESDDQPCFGVIGQHPRRPDPAKPNIDHLIQSPTFVSRFGKVTEMQVFAQLQTYCGYQRGGPLGTGEILMTDDNGDAHIFQAETFSVTHHTLTLARYARPASIQVQVSGRAMAGRA
jgi:hypothetical protein